MTGQHANRLNSLRIIRATTWAFLLLLALPQTVFAQAPQAKHPVDAVQVENPGTDLWREVRQRGLSTDGISQVKGVDSNILINPYGDPWARFRVTEIVTYGALLLGATLLVILLFFLVRGRIRIKNGFSGKVVRRFNKFQMIAHWSLASIFIFLAITGLVLLFGRTALIPLIGHEAFSALAWVSKEGHNIIGLLLVVSLLMMLFGLARRNLYEKGDLKWLMTAGGVIGKSHPSIGFFNLGEKCLFWMVILLGLVISVSGIVLLTPFLGQGRVVMEISHLVHVASTLMLLAVSFGHMYLGTVGVEGALSGMTTGYVDINWADAHHDRWAKQCRDRGKVVSADEVGAGRPG